MPEQENENLIETVDEEGNLVYFQLFDVIEFEGKDYALLLPVDEDEEEDDLDPELVLMRLISADNDEYSLETITDEDEFNAVSEYIASFADEDEE